MTIPGFTAEACVSAAKDHYAATVAHARTGGLIKPAFSLSPCVKSCVEGNFDPGWCRCICSGLGVKHCGYGE
jgi:hypothetical protein